MSNSNSNIVLERKLRFWQNAVVWPVVTFLVLGFGFYCVKEQIRARS